MPAGDERGRWTGRGRTADGWRLGRGIAGAAVLIGAITILARVTGFVKQLVFARAVGTNCLGTAYYTANLVPNIVFEVVAGGALAGMVVPVLAGAAARATPRRGPRWARIASALLTWVLVLLVPLAVLDRADGRAGRAAARRRRLPAARQTR